MAKLLSEQRVEGMAGGGHDSEKTQEKHSEFHRNKEANTETLHIR